MSSVFTELNKLTKSSDDVYSIGANQADFAYTDGAESEQALRRILTNASDLTSDSRELGDQICDWPTEYHLSSSRANLLRCLNLSSVKRVLELGCGCGSITRYLGEQSGLEIDSIEGSPTRAALAALRCRDLANVTISNANFNEVDFPENYYDLILFVGVTEYAGRFSDRDSDELALQDLLQIAQRASTKNGTTLIAIENRTGLKYLFGATEDHFGKPYVGIQNYPEKVGIRTYTKAEWLQQIASANFSHYEFLYPFPDYKIPTQIIHNSVLTDKTEENASRLADVFSKIKSRDYLLPFDLGEKEEHLWQGLCEAGTVAEHANSFLILLSNDVNSLAHLAELSITQFEDKSHFEHLSQAASGSEHAENDNLNKINTLQSQLNLIYRSRGWRFLNKLRTIFKLFGLGQKG